MIYRSPEEQAKVIRDNSVYGATAVISTSDRIVATVMQRVKAENDKLPADKIQESFDAMDKVDSFSITSDFGLFHLDPHNIFHKLFDISMSDIEYIDKLNGSTLKLYLLINFRAEVAQVVSIEKSIEWKRNLDDIPELLTSDERVAIIASLCLDKGLEWDGGMISLEEALEFIYDRFPNDKGAN